MTDPVLNKIWIPLDALYSLRQIDLMIKYRQPALPCFNMCFVLHCIPGWIHTGSGACSTCKITTSKRMGLKRRRKWDIVWVMYVHWTDNNPIADVCLALKKCGCKNECSGRCTCKRI